VLLYDVAVTGFLLQLGWRFGSFLKTAFALVLF
jgi:hypothetical protein